jgi:acyl-CoA dehydrogenase
VGDSGTALLVQALDDLFRTHCSPQVVSDAAAGNYATDLWLRVAETGLPWMGIPESLGGEGGDLPDVTAALQVSGQHAVPLPVAECLQASWLLAGAGLEILREALTVVVLPPDNDGSLEHIVKSDLVTRGVHYAGATNYWVLLHAGGGAAEVALVEPGVIIEKTRNLAGEPRDTVSLSGCRILAVSELEPRLVPIIEARAALLRAALMAGALTEVLRLSLAHSLTRVQFGKPIAQFQVVQNSIARAASLVAVARVSAESAATLDGPDFFMGAAAAKILAGRAASEVSAIAHQVHGAMGITAEHSLKNSTLRLWSWRDEDGSDLDWSRRLGQYVLEASEGGLWPLVSGM